VSKNGDGSFFASNQFYCLCGNFDRVNSIVCASTLVDSTRNCENCGGIALRRCPSLPNIIRAVTGDVGSDDGDVAVGVAVADAVAVAVADAVAVAVDDAVEECPLFHVAVCSSDSGMFFINKWKCCSQQPRHCTGGGKCTGRTSSNAPVPISGGSQDYTVQIHPGHLDAWLSLAPRYT
jgi:hypothetical protein